MLPLKFHIQNGHRVKFHIQNGQQVKSTQAIIYTAFCYFHLYLAYYYFHWGKNSQLLVGKIETIALKKIRERHHRLENPSEERIKPISHKKTPSKTHLILNSHTGRVQPQQECMRLGS